MPYHRTALGPSRRIWVRALQRRSLWSHFEFWGVTATTVLAIASYWLASKSPLYTDELGWKLIQSRFLTDGHLSRSATLAPSCGPDVFPTPALLVPIRYVDSIVGQIFSTPGAIRDYGLFLFFVWLGVAWTLMRRLFATAASGWAVLGAIVGAATLGVMPLLMVLN